MSDIEINQTTGEITIGSSLVVTDRKVKVSLNDTTPGFLEGKITGSGAIVVAVTNEGGDEKLDFSTSGAVGEANTTSNSGGGDGLALAKVGVDLPFKSLTAGTGITLTPSPTELEIASSAAGEANTTSNSGAGEGLALTKLGVDLPFKTLVAGSGITLTSAADTLTIISAGSAGDVIGPGASTDHALARFDLGTGKVIQNSVATLSDAGAMVFPVGGSISVPGAGANSQRIGLATATQTNALAWGDATTSATGIGSLAIGIGADASLNNATAVGNSAQALATDATAVGADSSVTGAGGIAVGQGARASAVDAICIGGGQARATGAFVAGSISSGLGAANSVSILGLSDGADDVTIGNGAMGGSGSGNVSIGANSFARNSSVSIGMNATQTSNSTGVAIGYASSSFKQGAAVGQSADALGTLGQNTSFGSFAVSSGDDANAWGAVSLSSGPDANAWGTRSVASGAQALAVGNDTDATATAAMAIGDSAQGTHAGGIALGVSAITTAIDRCTIGTIAGSEDRELQIGLGFGAWGSAPPAAQPTITGSRGGNAALADLLTQLAATGLIVDGTSA